MNKNNDASQEHNNTKCHTGYRDTIFFKTYDQEFLVIVGIIITSVFCLCTIIPIQIQPLLVIGGIMTLVQYLIYVCIMVYRNKKCPNYQAQEIVLYEGDLDELTFVLYKVGLKLKKKIGEYYIFTTSYRILSNSEFVIREGNTCCTLRGHPSLIQELKNYIELVQLKNKSKGEDHNTADNTA